MPRKKAAEIEILPPEDDQPLRGRKKLVEAEHTIKYSAPVPVTVEEDPEEDDQIFEDDPVDVEKKRKRKTAKTERDELRKKLMNHGVTAASTLKLIIERYVHSDGPDSGTTAEKSHCTKYGCDEAHVLNQDYMNVAARWGAGRYWFTLYKDGTIVTQWEKKLELPATPIVQHINPNDPTSPQVVYQQSTNGDGQQQIPMSIKDIMKTQREALKEQLEMAKLMREAYGFAPEQQQPKTEEEILSSAILKQPEVIENVVGSVIKRFGGASAKDDEPWYADVVRDAVKSGQLVQVVQVAIDRIFNGFGNLFPGRQNNGQAPMGAQTHAPVQPSQMAERETWQGQPQTENLDQGNQGALPPGGQQQTVETRSVAQQTSQTPEDQALQLLIEHCRRNIPAEIACDRLIGFADAINDQAPHLSIDPYISMFAQMPIDAALEFVRSQPNGEQVVALPHAQAWCAELQRLIKEAGQEGEE